MSGEELQKKLSGPMVVEKVDPLMIDMERGVRELQAHCWDFGARAKHFAARLPVEDPALKQVEVPTARLEDSGHRLVRDWRVKTGNPVTLQELRHRTGKIIETSRTV